MLAVGGIFVQQRVARVRYIQDLLGHISLAADDVPTVAFQELAAIPGQEADAKRALSQYWLRQARTASVQRPRDEAVLLLLKSLSIEQQPEAALQVRRILSSGSLFHVQHTFRHEDSVYSAAFSSDGRRVVTASDDKTARIWDAENGKPIGLPLQHKNWVLSAAFSSDGRRLVTASSDNTARIWDADNGKPIGLPLMHRDAVRSAAFSTEGRLVTRTDRALHWFAPGNDGQWQLESTLWNRALAMHPLSAPSPGGDTVRIAEVWTRDTLLLRDMPLHAPEQGLVELTETPAALLEEYQQRFSLRFEDDSRKRTLVNRDSRSQNP
ncbi:MAG: hypothetical protein NTY19_09910 [Planctomycetota bacterium]|nr:hypothetical protein [Planctomycetota bacterium]